MRLLVSLGMVALGCTVLCAVGCDDETENGGTAGAGAVGGTSAGGGGTGGTSTGVGGGGTGGTSTGVGGGTAGGATGGAGGGGQNPDCPADNPGDGTACTEPPGTWCSYGDDQCVCLMSDWRCHTCPSTEPTDGAQCDGTPGQPDRCLYGATQCICGGSDEWNCAQCPATEPTGSCIDERGLVCSYASTYCVCMGGGGNPQWNCMSLGTGGSGGGA